jgi:rifampicin phosphotransferase
MAGKYICFDKGPSSDATALVVGGKAANQMLLLEQQFPVPMFYVVTSLAFRTALTAQSPAGCGPELLDQLKRSNDGSACQIAAELRGLIQRLKLPDNIRLAIHAAHAARFTADTAVAVRSSAIGEDSFRQSFAGMYDSVLDVRGEDAVVHAIQQVWTSCFSDRAIAYRRRHGLELEAIEMAVVVQKMIEAHQSGVMFTCDPVTGDANEICIEAVRGSGQSLVQGTAVGTTYRVRKTNAGIVMAPAERASQAVLSDAQVMRVAEAGLAIERLFCSPQDVEFCFDAQGEFHVLQARPITTVSAPNASDAPHFVWDNSNIIESYSGVTTPLTFSFVRRAYGIVYLSFAEVMGISPHVVRANRATFENMLGLFRGRVYYNLKNWYRLVRMFPGYQYNRGFMEAMMGVREPLLLADEAPRPSRLRRWFVELPALGALIARISWKFLRIRTIVDSFQRHFDKHYAEWSQIDFHSRQPHELMALYRQMEDTMLSNWKAPIINDFFVMVFHGLLKQLCASWCHDRSGSLQNGLLCSTEGVESAKPAWLMLQLAQVASSNEALRELILHEPTESLPQSVANDSRFPEFQTLLNRYLAECGLRYANELKLESLSYRDRPELVYEMVRTYLLLDNGTKLDTEERKRREQSRLHEAESVAFAALKTKSTWWPRSTIFRFVLDRARLGIRNRENMRFARTKIYGIARSIFRALGEQFAKEGILDEATDVFYLTTDEFWNYIQGTAVSSDLRSLATVRRFEYDAYRTGDIPPPTNRFETHGLPYHRNDFRSVAHQDDNTGATALSGIGCCPGIVVGTVQVCDSPVDSGGIVGEVLVAERTDPGWVTIFPAFRGILIERGSVLSHSAIVARELGIPTLVGVTGLMARLRTGQRVRMDGERGTVEILAEERDESAAADLSIFDRASVAAKA